MKQPRLARRGMTVLAVAVVAALVGVTGLVALAPGASAISGTTGPIDVTVSPTDGLVTGQSINISASRNDGSSTITAIKAHICDPAITPLNDFNYSYQSTFCVTSVPANRLSGSLGTNVIQNYETSQTFASVTSGASTFTAGTGTVTWRDELDSGAPGFGPEDQHTLTCDSTHSCDLVVRIERTGGNSYFRAPLTYAGNPAAPTLNTANAGNGSVSLAWTPAVDVGNGTIHHYQVEWTGPTSGSQDVTAPTTTANISGLTNFGLYSFTVRTHTRASDGVTPFSSVQSNSLSATPAPGGPPKPTGSPLDTAVNLSWGAASGSPSRYRVTATNLDAPPPAPAPSFTVGPVTTLTISGLTNGDRYTFTVAAEYGVGEFTTESPASDPITPNGKFITQTITVTRPQGDLVLTQACSPLTPDPYPQDDTTGLVIQPPYPTNCTIALGAAKLIKTGPGAGQYFAASGALHEVSVVDARDTDPGWTINAVMGQFNDGAKSFNGSALGWTPAETHTAPFTSPDGSYAMQVQPGSVVAPATLGGLGVSATLAKGGNDVGPMASGQGGLGIARLNAALTIWIPIFAQAGNYTGVMTITAI